MTRSTTSTNSCCCAFKRTTNSPRRYRFNEPRFVLLLSLLLLLSNEPFSFDINDSFVVVVVLKNDCNGLALIGRISWPGKIRLSGDDDDKNNGPPTPFIRLLLPFPPNKLLLINLLLINGDDGVNGQSSFRLVSIVILMAVVGCSKAVAEESLPFEFNLFNVDANLH
ncbi:hypothetical protein DERP_003152 [Dermatophagoides pteronyssinus]|uniref:Transmembrane protein n=1 Tax=Dermatophagoides pteronyssinus TaxID=6956 RepID=A0ABQ8JIN8_DERPT|nr:hypothetical protein DERP_003152 [Dermatophagoides pteronyssinus]